MPNRANSCSVQICSALCRSAMFHQNGTRRLISGHGLHTSARGYTGIGSAFYLGMANNHGVEYDTYELGNGRKILVDRSAAKGASVITFTQADGSIVPAYRVYYPNGTMELSGPGSV